MNKALLEMMESRIRMDLRVADSLKGSQKKDKLNFILGFLAGYFWAGGDNDFYTSVTEETVHKIVWETDEE